MTYPMPTAPSFTLAILAGGRGSRMGARKDRLHIHGRPILSHLLEALRFTGPTLLVTSKDRPEPLGFQAFDEVVFDSVEGAGPTAGIVAALSAARTPHVAVLSCDMPGITAVQLDWLLARFAELNGSTFGLMCRRPGDRIEPFPAVYRTEARPAIPLGGALNRLLDDPRFVAVDTPPDWPDPTWLNLNRVNDLPSAGATLTTFVADTSEP